MGWRRDWTGGGAEIGLVAQEEDWCRRRDRIGGTGIGLVVVVQ